MLLLILVMLIIEGEKRMTEFNIYSPECSTRENTNDCQAFAKVTSEFYKMQFLVCLCKSCSKYFCVSKFSSAPGDEKTYTAVAKNFWDSFDEDISRVVPNGID